MIVWTLMIQRNSRIPRYSITQREISIESIDFNNPKVFGDTSILDGPVLLDITVTHLICQNKLPLTSITDIVIVVTIVSSWGIDQIFFLSQEYISQSPQSRESDLWIQIIDTGNPFSRHWPDIFSKVHTHQTDHRRDITHFLLYTMI